MTQACSVCTHEERYAIEQDVLVYRKPQNATAELYGISTTALNRHLKTCIPEATTALAGSFREELEAVHHRSLASLVELRLAKHSAFEDYVFEQLAAAKNSGENMSPRDVVNAYKAIADVQIKLLTLRGQLTGELKQDHNVTVNQLNDATIIAALEGVARRMGVEPQVFSDMLKAELNGEGATPALGLVDGGEDG